MTVYRQPAVPAAARTELFCAPYGGLKNGFVVRPASGAMIASARVSSLRICAPVRPVRSGWSRVWLPRAKRSGCALTSARTCFPIGVELICPVGKIVALTWLAISQFMMSTAGSSRPPMSNVSATCPDDLGPWLRRRLAPVGELPGEADGRALAPGLARGLAAGDGLGRNEGAAPGSGRSEGSTV